jgi:CRP-like cAMP-binding protein
MVPIELIRRYPFFAGFNQDQVTDLADVANQVSVQAGYKFIKEGEWLTNFYLVLEGTVGIIIKVPDREMDQSLTRQITNNLITRDITVSSVGEGEMFGWSALVPPNISTANVKALTPCRVLEIDYQALKPIIEEDCCFGHLLTLKAAQVIRGRLRDRRTENLAEVVV